MSITTTYYTKFKGGKIISSLSGGVNLIWKVEEDNIRKNTGIKE